VSTLEYSHANVAQYDPFDLALSELYTSKDMSKYQKLIEIGVRNNDPLAQYAMATWYLHGNTQLNISPNLKRAVGLLEKASLTLNRAMYDLGVCFSTGNGKPRNPRRAYRLFSRSAELGCLAAMSAQADCLEFGVGVRKSVSRAKKLRRKADELMSRIANLSA